MNIFEDLPLGKPKKSEPAWHPAIKRSFLFVPTAGMRVAPEVLVLELYREIFFDQRSDQAKAKDFNIENDGFSDIEQAVLYASRGRKKQNRQSNDANFYTPAFPSLARHSWLRKQSDRVVRDFLFRALSQAIHGHGKNVEAKIKKASALIYSALIGGNTKANPEFQELDILGLGFDVLEGCLDKQSSLERIRKHLGEIASDRDGSSYNNVFKTEDKVDPLASRIFNDFISLCELEARLDRIQWLDLLKCFLRLSTAVWLLAQMRLTVLSRDTLIQVLKGDKTSFSSKWPKHEIEARRIDILRPSVTPTGQVQAQIDEYMRARVELNLLVALTEKHSGEDWQKYTITVNREGSGSLKLVDLMLRAKKIKSKIDEDLAGASISSMLTRECQKYRAWLAPRRKSYGQGVNYDEFLRVLRRMTQGDEDGGYLLNQEGSGFVVFPGHLMLKLIAFLASQTVTDRSLVLADLENHFLEYGIDFGKAAGARPRLLATLQEIGMLQGAPDAGDSVKIARPYNKGK